MFGLAWVPVPQKMDVFSSSLRIFSEHDQHTLRFAALQETRVQADFADMVTVQHPAKKTLQTKTVATVRARSESPLNNEKQLLKFLIYIQ